MNVLSFLRPVLLGAAVVSSFTPACLSRDELAESAEALAPSTTDAFPETKAAGEVDALRVELTVSDSRALQRLLRIGEPRTDTLLAPWDNAAKDNRKTVDISCPPPDEKRVIPEIEYRTRSDRSTKYTAS